MSSTCTLVDAIVYLADEVTGDVLTSSNPRLAALDPKNRCSLRPVGRPQNSLKS